MPNYSTNAKTNTVILLKVKIWCCNGSEKNMHILIRILEQSGKKKVYSQNL